MEWGDHQINDKVPASKDHKVLQNKPDTYPLQSDTGDSADSDASRTLREIKVILTAEQEQIIFIGFWGRKWLILKGELGREN